MRISDWSSDVCSSDLRGDEPRRGGGGAGGCGAEAPPAEAPLHPPAHGGEPRLRPRGDQPLRGFWAGGVSSPSKIGRASCRERGCQYVKCGVVAGSLKKKDKKHH